MIAEKIPALKTLSPEEKLILVAEIWDELAAKTRGISYSGRSRQNPPRAARTLPTAS
jgi:hypothetical protein